MNTVENCSKQHLSMLERWKAPTPLLFKRLRNIGLILAGIAGAILSSPITLPPLIISVAGYVMVASGVLSSVSQITIEKDE